MITKQKAQEIREQRLTNAKLAEVVGMAKTMMQLQDVAHAKRLAAAKNACRGPNNYKVEFGPPCKVVRMSRREPSDPMYAAKEELLPTNWGQTQKKQEEQHRLNMRRHRGEVEGHDGENKDTPSSS